MVRLITVLGARPQFIKAAALSRVLKSEFAGQIDEKIVHTGQHYDVNMSDVFFTEMQIPRPHYQLAVGGGNHGAMTGQMLGQVEEILLKEKPDAVLVYGDTNSTLAGSLAAAKLHIPVAHVEAGLRSHNMRMPEEINRILTDRLSKLLFCPSQSSVENLVSEGVAKENCHVVGDVMYDTALFYSKQAQASPAVASLLGQLKSAPVLCSIHRAENTDKRENLEAIVNTLEAVASETPVILPLHPRTAKFLEQYSLKFEKTHILPPVGYFDMLKLLEASSFVMTDSGGLQKEAFFFGKPCITLREETEWVELVDQGFNKIVGTNPEKIRAAISHFRSAPLNFKTQIYGDGNASRKIAKLIAEKILN